MRVLPAGEVLRLWEECQDASPDGRALALAAAVGGGIGSAELADRPVGRVTALLLRLRTALAGPEMSAAVTCPDCGQTVEFQAGTGPLLALEDKVVDSPPPLLHGGHDVTWRSPSYGDLLAIAEQPGAADPDRGAALLLDRCVLRVRHEEGTAPVTAADLPEAVREALSEAMSTADPLADVLVDLRCPDCGSEFTAGFDAAAFVWAEVESRARHLLLDIDALARSYGWSESDVLALSEPRRAAYLRIVTGELP